MASQVEAIKWVPGTRFIVDGFRFQNPSCKAYFLTHCHSDHTTGLTSRFDSGLIYCSPISYRLLVHDMGLRPHILRPVEVNVSIFIDGIRVVAIDANHCPGAVCFLFCLPDGTRILHTGDFRWDRRIHATHPELQDGVSMLILDTTYLMPKWAFPPQNEAVERMVNALREEHTTHPNTLFVCMSYHIGKERAYFGAADALDWKIWAPDAKCEVLRLLDLPSRWLSMLTDRPEEAQMHVLGMGHDLHAQSLADRIVGTAWDRVVVIKPTGWTYRPRKADTLERREEGCVVTLGVPYSEHSSYTELRDCVRVLRPKRVIPTVNAGDAAKARALVDRLASLMDLSEDKSRLDAYFSSKRPKVTECSAEGSNSEDAGPSSKVKPADGNFDLLSVDVEEQRQLWERITQGGKLGKTQPSKGMTPRTNIRAFLVPKSN